MGLKHLLKRAATQVVGWRFFEPAFLITGTGRSGSGYIASLLRHAGIRCGHEQWWSLNGNRSLRLQGDSSWVAAFQIDGYTGQVFHQIRNPILVMNSHYWDLTVGNKRGQQVRQYRSQWVSLSGDVREDVMSIYLAWFEKAEEYAERRWRLEDIDPFLLQSIGEWVGTPISIERAEAAIEHVSPQTNAHVATHPPISWEDLPEGYPKDSLKAIARRHGYLSAE